MKHRLHIMVTALCLAVILAAMAWVTVAALRLDRLQAGAQERAAFEEKVRLALWRMETALAPLLARESARPYFVYSAFCPAERAYNRMFEEIERGEVLVPSPLLTEPSPYVLLHFQVGPDGTLTSPQVPGTDEAPPPAQAKRKPIRADPACARRLIALRAEIVPSALFAALPARPRPPRAAQPVAQSQSRPLGPAQADVPQQIARMEAWESAKNLNEWNARVGQQAVFQKGVNLSVPQTVRQRPDTPRAVSSGVEEEAMKALWLEDRLLLARRIAVSGGEYAQGCWLDWPALKHDLLEKIRDLLPSADLRPARGEAVNAGGRLLAALPLRLVPGEVPASAGRGLTPIRTALIVAWCCLVLTAGAVTGVLAGVISLSERRAAFTSAVTHELRTPLATFRMYTEMLTEGMIPEEGKRREYVATLHAEALRLSHLVENVLAYARLERGRATRPTEIVGVDAILGRAADRLRQRAAGAGLTLLLPEPAGLPAARLRADVSAVEQVLFNLVDNACKYAANAKDRRVHVEVTAAARAVVIRVRDHGPGIARGDWRHLFQPFRKSAERAASTAPGVGLGLALSRRLARALGGDLRLCRGVSDGACFELALPRAS